MSIFSLSRCLKRVPLLKGDWISTFSFLLPFFFFFTSQHQPQKGQSFALSDKCHNKNYSLDNNSDNAKFARGSLGLVHHNLTYKKLNLMILEVKFSNLNSVILWMTQVTTWQQKHLNKTLSFQPASTQGRPTSRIFRSLIPLSPCLAVF